MAELTKNEIAVIRALYAIHRPAKVSELTKPAKLSWHTVNKTLYSLMDKGGIVVPVVKAPDGKVRYWWLDQKIMESL